ncbi:MAG: HEAT repeat domain-containing protein [Myxococcota bacterium]|nr:HEAT repeat domain-containing protein [Myxococcota bacterium]
MPTPAGRALLEDLLRRHREAPEALAVYELAAAARALGAWPQSEAQLMDLLDHPSADVREAAGESLGRMGSAAAVRALRRRLERERDVGVRACLMRALGPRSGHAVRENMPGGARGAGP